MAFLETPRYPEEVSPWLVGGEEFMTDIVMTQGGNETRNQVWSQPLRRYRLSSGLRTLANVQETKAFFRAVSGRANGFRVKDWYDFSVTASTGMLGSGYGTGLPAYQLGKAYIAGATSSIGKVVKPVSGQVAVKRNSTPVTVGTAAGNCAIDTTTGIITFVADTSSAVATPFSGTASFATNVMTMVSTTAGALAIGSIITSAGITAGTTILSGTDPTWTLSTSPGTIATQAASSDSMALGATTTLVLTTNPGTMVAGQKLYLSGFTGADAATLNGKAHSIISVTGAAPYVFTLDTVTTGKTITVGAGTGYHYPQASDALNWVGEFDIPVRFDMDWLQTGMDTGLMVWDNITMIELRL